MENKDTSFNFTFNHVESYFRTVLDEGYTVMTCYDYFLHKTSGKPLPPKTLVNRVDIDFALKKTRRLTDIFNRLGIKATFFVRLHAPEYNPFSFEGYLCLKEMKDSGHEIGYHSEVVDQARIWGESDEACLKRDIGILNTMLGIEVKGAASHGGTTGLNNLDFWKNRIPQDFGLCYEGYDKQPGFNLFQESVYVSDSCWTFWKSYKNGVLAEGDRRTLAEHAKAGHSLIYSLIHPDTYYDSHFYE
jgi:hypothetical protein